MNHNTHGISSIIYSDAKKHRRRVVVAIKSADKTAIAYLKKVKRIVDVTIVGQRIPGFTSFEMTEEADMGLKMIELLEDGKVDAIVRGSVHPRYLFLPLFQKTGEEMSYFTGKDKTTIVIFEHVKTKRFFALTSVDLWQGFDIKQKKKEALENAHFLKTMNIEPYVAVMAMRRAKPKGARRPKGYTPVDIVEKSCKDAEATSAYLRKQGIKADLFDIEYDNALKAGANIIVPPIGPIGNAFARSLCFFTDEWELISAPSLHFSPLAIEDGFKAGVGKSYYNHIISAAATYNRNHRS